jgi:flavin-dependent dehydrogenase
MANQNHFDVAVLGGGVAGLSAALQLKDARPKTRILVLEKRSHPVPPSAYKVGEALAELSSHYFAHDLGMRDYLEENHLRKMGLRWFMSANGNQDISRRVEFGLTRFSPLPTFQIDRGAIENHMADLASDRGIDFRDSTPVTNVELGADRHTIKLGRNGTSGEVTARWIVDASGRQAYMRKQLGVGVDMPIKVNSAWFRTPNRMMVDEWCDDPAWRAQVPTGTRWKSTCSFVGKGYWSWVINLGSGAASVGVVADPKYVPWESIRRYEALTEWLRGVEPQLAAHLPEDEGDLLDFMKRKDFSHTCRRAFSRHRWALAGEAALFVDPLYSTGHDTGAIGNTLLVDLIQHELDGELGKDFSQRVRDANRALLGLVQTMTSAFPGALGMYGHAQATASKLLWDNVVYFSIVLNMFRSRGILKPDLLRSLKPTLTRVMQMNVFMQAQFRYWASSDRDVSRADVPNIHDFLFEHLVTASDDMSTEQLGDHIRVSAARLHSIAVEIVAHMSEAAGEQMPEFPYDPLPTTGEDLVLWSNFERRSGPSAGRDPQPEDGWVIR